MANCGLRPPCRNGPNSLDGGPTSRIAHFPYSRVDLAWQARRLAKVKKACGIERIENN